MSPKSKLAARAKYVRSAVTEKFTDLIELSGLQPSSDLKGLDWSGVDFSYCNLDGYDLTGSYLHGCKFDGARIALTDVGGAELGRVLLDLNRSPNLPAVTTPIANLRRAHQWWPLPGHDYRRAYANQDAFLRTGSVFQDAPFAPLMVVVPTGSFLQGDETILEDGINRREVSISHSIAIGRFAVTIDEWQVCVSNRRTSYNPNVKQSSGRLPVTGVSWNDIADNYLPWLNSRLGLSGVNAYRLPSEAEWEYCCRAGTKTAYCFGDTVSGLQAQFSVKGGGEKVTVEVGSFQHNAWGLHDMHGNVWEWCQDAYHDDYRNAPHGGLPREDMQINRSHRVLRGGSWNDPAIHLRSAHRFGDFSSSRFWTYGFRVARTLFPRLV